MSRRRIVWTIAAALLAAASFAACSRRSLLPDAYYAQHMIPIYPDAKLADQMESDSYGDGPDQSWDGNAWWLKSKDDPDRIVAFYDSKLVGWHKETGDDGEVIFKTVPPGGEEGEEVFVRIEIDGRILIGESVKSKRRTHRS